MRRLAHPLVFLLVLFLLVPVLTAPAQAARIKDLASIAGVRTNQLVGYGLVVGLDGTGDQVIQAPFTVQSLKSMLAQLGVNVPEGVNPQLTTLVVGTAIGRRMLDA